jgi:O-antigen ligase
MVMGRSVVQRFLEAPEASHLAREEFNRAALMMARDHPMGVGINQFSEVLSTTPRYHSHVMVMANEEQAGVCHHVYLLNAAELGWVGLIVFIVIIVRFLWPPLRMALTQRDLEGLLPMGFLAGAVALHLSGLLEWVFRITPVFFLYLICCGVVVGLADLRRIEAARASRERRAVPEAS